MSLAPPYKASCRHTGCTVICSQLCRATCILDVESTLRTMWRRAALVSTLLRRKWKPKEMVCLKILLVNKDLGNSLQLPQKIHAGCLQSRISLTLQDINVASHLLYFAVLIS